MWVRKTFSAFSASADPFLNLPIVSVAGMAQVSLRLATAVNRRRTWENNYKM